jgi:hypothetical protein
MPVVAELTTVQELAKQKQNLAELEMRQQEEITREEARTAARQHRVSEELAQSAGVSDPEGAAEWAALMASWNV